MEKEKRVVRNNELKVMFGNEERKRLQKKAEELGLKPSQYIRMVSLNANIEVEK